MIVRGKDDWLHYFDVSDNLIHTHRLKSEVKDAYLDLGENLSYKIENQILWLKEGEEET